jgi:hypothetical protein
MAATVTLRGLNESRMRQLAELVAFLARPGDAVTLQGDLGAGKTTLARALISALMGGGQHEIPSPTFTIVQTYATPRMGVAHVDLYRLADASELDELGLWAADQPALTILEWPDRAADRLPADRLEIAIADNGEQELHCAGKRELRDVVLGGHGGWADRLDRLAAIAGLIDTAGFTGEAASLLYLQGDASVRRYGRLRSDGRGAILMDWPRQPDGPPIRDGKPYSRIAHLAEHVRPFVAMSAGLDAAGMSVPRVLAHDLDRGLLLLEDLGDEVFGAMVAADAARQPELWHAAVDALVALRGFDASRALPLPDGSTYTLPHYDPGALAIETELLVDWYWPASHQGAPIPADIRAEFVALWSPLLARLDRLPKGLVLRDYHSPNLMWLGDRLGVRRVGIIDFQDALQGHAAYDLVSLAEDARLDVPVALEAELLDHYCRAARAADPHFDEAELRFAYAVLGAQRNTKIAGIFARLARRDGKPQYLAHLPRIWGYLTRNLESPDLAALRAWYDRHLPARLRTSVPAV